ncbi:MAG: hypothetical protein SGCHY_000993 [Lobulomycetales sp.]
MPLKSFASEYADNFLPYKTAMQKLSDHSVSKLGTSSTVQSEAVWKVPEKSPTERRMAAALAREERQKQEMVAGRGVSIAHTDYKDWGNRFKGVGDANLVKAAQIKGGPTFAFRGCSTYSRDFCPSGVVEKPQKYSDFHRASGIPGNDIKIAMDTSGVSAREYKSNAAYIQEKVDRETRLRVRQEEARREKEHIPFPLVKLIV